MNPLFTNDYLAGCHPALLQRLVATNLEQTGGYGHDPYSKAAREHIRRAVGRADAAVHFLVGGTQTNTTVIAALLRPTQGVIAAASGHISSHETGAIEARGHKVLELPHREGKLTAAALERYYRDYYGDSPIQEHIVQPALVYLSQPTELGTVYSRSELAAIAAVCRRSGLALFVDGARLAYALDPAVSDVDLPTLAEYCDVFSIGGTKCGALFGEAVVMVNPACQSNFRALIKQQGGLLAKGRLLGLQFEELFRDGLYQRLGQTAVQQAQRIRRAFLERGVEFHGSSCTNQQFPLLPPPLAEYFINNFGFDYLGERQGERLITRYCTSWATGDEQVATLLAAINERCPR